MGLARSCLTVTEEIYVIALLEFVQKKWHHGVVHSFIIHCVVNIMLHELEHIRVFTCLGVLKANLILIDRLELLN